VIGAATAFYTQYAARKSEADKRLAERLDELRGVLDDAAKALAEALSELPDLLPWRQHVLENSRRVFLHGETPPWEAAKQAISKAEQQSARLHIRLGAGTIVGSYGHAAHELRDYLTRLDLSGYRDQLTRPTTDDPKVTEWLEGRVDQALRMVVNAKEAQLKFGVAAAKMLGVPGVPIERSQVRDPGSVP
jgi:hypothetical protein